MIAGQSRKAAVALGTILITLTVLIILTPYAFGYGTARRTIAVILTDRWFASESTTWQYCALVPLVVGWLVWKRRAMLLDLPIKGALSGVIFMLLGMGSYFVGYKANNYYFGYVAVQLFILGAVVWMLGWRWMRALLFPWIVLGLAWPLYFLEERLGFPMRMISTQGVMFIARLLHLPVTSEGTSILSASPGVAIGSWMTLKVDGPCSGMNSLFALMFVALLFSHHQQPTLLRRAGLYMLSIPLALLGNMVRIALLIAGCALFGQDFAVGNAQNEMSSYHLVAGLLVFVVAFTGLQAASNLINRWCKTKSPSRSVRRRPADQLQPSTP